MTIRNHFILRCFGFHSTSKDAKCEVTLPVRWWIRCAYWTLTGKNKLP